MTESNDLINFISTVSGEGKLRVEENLGAGFVRLRIAEAERRQAKHDIQCVEDIVIEMLRNSRDANARNIFVSTYKEGSIRRLSLIDDGDGVPFDLQERIFDARVTSKLESMHVDKWGVHGRGMALYSISQNTSKAYVASSGKNLGCSLVVEVDTSELPEKTDQSTWPEYGKNDENETFVSRGPHNILRTVCEFALECKGKVNVYIGTPTEVASTLYAMYEDALTPQQLLFCDDTSELPVTSRLRAAADAEDFITLASSIGLDLSERTAHRILADKMGVLIPVAPKVRCSKSKKIDIYKDSRGLKINEEDKQEFQNDLKKAFAELSDKYYMNSIGEPKIRITKDKITVSFEYVKE